MELPPTPTVLLIKVLFIVIAGDYQNLRDTNTLSWSGSNAIAFVVGAEGLGLTSTQS